MAALTEARLAEAPRNTILQGDVLDQIRTLPDGCVQTVITSPPYWNLRDYGVPGQIGLEATPDAWLQRMVAVFAEVRRVLRDDGTLWLNIGDCYATHAKGHSGFATSTLDQTAQAWQDVTSEHRRGDDTRSALAIGLKDKDLIGLPWMLAFALRADGWYLRSDIVWSKPNPMPESVADRPTRAHEYLFLFAKSQRYYYDADAIREPVKASSVARIQQANFANQTGGAKDFAAAGVNANRSMRRTLEHFADKQRGHSRRHAGFNDRWDAMSRDEQQANGANRRDVWMIATQPFAEAHFATFPMALVEPCIAAGSRPGDLVLDPFMGSGTVGVVCRRMGRDYLGIELNPAYVEMAQRRIAKEVQPMLLYSPRRDAGTAS